MSILLSDIHKQIVADNPENYKTLERYKEKLIKMVKCFPKDPRLSSQYPREEYTIVTFLWDFQEMKIELSGDFTDRKKATYELELRSEDHFYPFVYFNHMEELEDVFFEVVVKKLKKYVNYSAIEARC